MVWGCVDLRRDMGPAARVLLDEYERRCDGFGVESHEVERFIATELGFEHNLGLLHKSYQMRALRPVRCGVLEHEYYLERCLLEAEGASFIQRGVTMCAAIVGDQMVEEMCQRLFLREVEVIPPFQFQIPELRIQPASTVGMDQRVGEFDCAQEIQVDPLQPGFCYLALIKPEFVGEARSVLGSEPALKDLIQFGGADKFLPDTDLTCLYISQVGKGYHVGSRGTCSFSDVLQEVRGDPDAGEWSVQCFDYLGQYGVGADASTILCDWLSTSVGKDVKLSDHSLQLVTKSAALLDSGAKKRLRSLEAVGDAALSMMIARDNYFRSESVERYQTLRSFVTSNRVLSEKFIQNVPPDAVLFVPGVNPSAGVVGAKALEAIFGAVWLDLGDSVLADLLVALGFLDFPLQVTSAFPFKSS